MRRAIMATVLGTIALFIALFTVSRSASAEDIDDYRWHNSYAFYPWSPSWDPYRSNCRVVDFYTTNRWGTDVTVHRRICD